MFLLGDFLLSGVQSCREGFAPCPCWGLSQTPGGTRQLSGQLQKQSFWGSFQAANRSKLGCSHIPEALLSTLITGEDGLRITGRWKRSNGDRSSEIPARPPRAGAAALPYSSRRNGGREQRVTVLEMGSLHFSLINVCCLFLLINTKVQMKRRLCSYGSGGERNPKTQLGASISRGCKSLSMLSGSEGVWSTGTKAKGPCSTTHILTLNFRTRIKRVTPSPLPH